MRLRILFPLLLILVAIGIFFYRYLNQPNKSEFLFYPMGGIPCRVVTYDIPAERFVEVTGLIKKRVEELEEIFNDIRPTSEVSEFGRALPDQWQPVSPEMYNLLEHSLVWYGRSGGTFDITVAPLSNLWKRSAQEGIWPIPERIAEIKRHTGSSSLILSPTQGVKFSQKGMRLDFGGIAKGYILDEIGRLLEERGMPKYVFSCGGDVVMSGKKSFRVGIQEPGGAQGDLMMVLTMPAGAIVTSGHYERRFTIGDKTFSHIIDPGSGQPVDNDLISITIVGKNATDADALATAIAVMGLQRGKEFLKKAKEYQAVLVAEREGKREIYYSEPLAGKLEYKKEWAKVPHIPF